jgi:hypothetical protein
MVEVVKAAAELPHSKWLFSEQRRGRLRVLKANSWGARDGVARFLFCLVNG